MYICTVKKFVLNLTFHVSQMVYSNHVNLTLDEYVTKHYVKINTKNVIF